MVQVAEEESVIAIDVEEWFTDKVAAMGLGVHELAAKLAEHTKDVASAEALTELGP